MGIETSKYEKHQNNWFQTIGKWLIIFPTFKMTLIGTTRSIFLLSWTKISFWQYAVSANAQHKQIDSL